MKKLLIILSVSVILCGCEESPKVNTQDLQYLSKTFKEYRIEPVANSALVIVYADGTEYYWNSNMPASETNLVKRNSN